MPILPRLATWLSGLTGVKRALLAVILGAVSVFAFAPLHVWPVLFISFGGLVWLLDGCHDANETWKARLVSAAWTGFWFGFGYFFTGLYWVAEAFLVEPWRHAWLIPFVMTALPGGMALFYAAAGAIAMALWRPGPARIFALAIAFGAAEYARGHVLTGFPWNLIGYALLPDGALMQMASVLGVYAVSFLAVLLFAAPPGIWDPRHGLSKSTAGLAGVLLVSLGLAYVWGERRLAQTDEATTDIRLRIVQANIDQAEKWRPENSAEILEDYLALTRTEGLGEIDIVIWPETALPFFLTESTVALKAIGAALPTDTLLLVGAARVVSERDADRKLADRRVYNSLLAVSDAGQIIDGYDKVHLVPFGEYLPFQDSLESLGIMQMTGVRGGFSEGKGPRILELPGLPPAVPLICYEIIFPGQIVDPTQRPEWLINVTNDAWFGVTGGPYQHFHQAQVRAVEQDLPLVRAANTGISAVIDRLGRVRAKLDLGTKGIIDTNLPKVGPHNAYAELFWLTEVLVFLSLIFGLILFHVPCACPRLTGKS